MCYMTMCCRISDRRTSACKLHEDELQISTAFGSGLQGGLYLKIVFSTVRKSHNIIAQNEELLQSVDKLALEI